MRHIGHIFTFAALLALGGCKAWLFDKQPDNAASNIAPISNDAMDTVVANVAAGASIAGPDEACASQNTYDAIKKNIFDAARAKTTSNPKPLLSLANAAVLRIDAPLVQATNLQLQRTDCVGQMSLIIPAAASSAFGGVSALHANLNYSVQAAADGSGTVVTLTGNSADSVIGQLASATDTLNLSRGQGAPGGSVTAFAGKTYNPSFDCGGKLTNAMRMICQDEDLARADRDMNAQYAQAKLATPKPDLPNLIQAQRAFLKQREACPDSDCISTLYEQRAQALAATAE